jgi:hypothetical protein
MNLHTYIGYSKYTKYANRNLKHLIHINVKTHTFDENLMFLVSSGSGRHFTNPVIIRK